MLRSPTLPPFPYTTLFRSRVGIERREDEPAIARDLRRGEETPFREVELAVAELSCRDAGEPAVVAVGPAVIGTGELRGVRSEEHTSELQSLRHLVCRLLLE